MNPLVLFFIVLALTIFVFGVDIKQKRSQILTKR